MQVLASAELIGLYIFRFKKMELSNKFKKCHLIAMQEIAVSSTAMTHTYWSSPISLRTACCGATGFQNCETRK